VQSAYRGLDGRRAARKKRFGQREYAAGEIQRFVRGALARKALERDKRGMEAGAKLIQKYYRMHQFFVLNTAAARIQRHYRHNCVGRAARRIQTNFRGFVGRFWCAREKAKLRAMETQRRNREVRELRAATDAAVFAIEERWVTKEGKKEMKEEVRKMKAARKAAARERKKNAPKNDKTSKDRENVRAVFSTFDVDLSGSIDRDELRALMLELCIPVTEEDLEAAMKAIDTDGSGTIGFDEFHEWLKGHKSEAHQEALALLHLKSKKMLRDMFGHSVEAQTKRVLLLRKKSEVYSKVLTEFRARNPPPFETACTRAFVFPWEFKEYEENARPALSNVDELVRFYSSFYGQQSF